jgi:tetratricopeptide (TPR) repeat protein
MGGSHPGERRIDSKSVKFMLLVVFTALFIQPLFPEDLPLRTVTIKIAADHRLKATGKWKIDSKRSLKAVSDIFAKEFGIEFQIIDYEYWQPDAKQKTMRDRLNDLQNRVIRDESDIVLGLLLKDRGAVIPEGIASYIHGYILLDYSESQKETDKVLLHEICHIFGACDITEKGSIMDCENSGTKFDEFTRKIIQLNRCRSFHRNEFPIPSNILDEAIDLYSRRYDLKQDEPGIALSLVFLHMEKQDPHAAMKICQRLLDDHPHIHEIHTIMGNICNRIGDLDAALSEYKKALEFNPEVPETHFNLGLIHTQKGNLDLAVAEYEKAIRLNPSYARAHCNLGNLLLIKGELDRAIKECGIALQLYPDLPEALCTMAAALIQTRNILEQTRNPATPGDTDNFAARNEGEDLVNQAIALCKKALTIHADLPIAYNILGMAYVYQQKNIEAEKAFLTALNLKPDFTEAHMNLGTMYFHGNFLEKAAFHIKKILEIDPSSGVSLDILEKIFWGQQSYSPQHGTQNTNKQKDFPPYSPSRY